MLDFIRNHRSFFSLFFLLAGTAMVVSMFGDPYAGRGNSNLASGVVAKVDGEEISLQSLYAAVNNQRSQMQENIEEQVAKSDNKAETRKFLDQMLKMQVSSDRVLAEMIQRKFAERLSERLGLDVPPDAVVEMIRQLPYFQKNGKFDALQYKNMVAQPGLYEREIRREALVETLRRSFVTSLTVLSPEEQKIEGTLKKRRDLEILTISPATFSEKVVVSGAEIDAFMNDPSQEAKLQAFFDRNLRKYKSEEEVHARHILIDEAAGGEKKANEILADIKAGKITFADAAKKYSTDKSNSDKGGDLGFFGKGMMKPSFEAVAFALKNDQDLTEKPVKTDFGYHLIQRLGFKPASAKQLTDVKREIAEAVLTEQKKAGRAAEWAKAVVSSGKAPNDAELKRLGLTWSPVSWSPLDTTLGNISNVDDHRAKLLGLNASAPYYGELIKQGDAVSIVRLAAKKADPKTGVDDDSSPARLAQDKAYAALGFFMQEERSRLEKAKKIVRNDSALNQIKQALGDGNNPDFGGLPLGSP